MTLLTDQLGRCLALREEGDGEREGRGRRELREGGKKGQGLGRGAANLFFQEGYHVSSTLHVHSITHLLHRKRKESLRNTGSMA